MALKTKIGKSDIQGKGLLANMQLSAGSNVGVSHINDWPTENIGAFYNHSDTPNAMSTKNGNKRNVVVMNDIAPGEEITLDYRKQPELEQPEDFKAMGLLKMMAGGSMPAYQDGGGVEPKTKPKVKYTDPEKFKNAQELSSDSLNLYNAYQYHNQNFNPIPGTEKSMKTTGLYKGMTAQEVVDKGKKDYGDINHPGNMYSMVKKRGPMSDPSNTHTNDGIYNYYKTLEFKRPVIMENDESPDIYHRDIRPVKLEFDGISHRSVYAEPKTEPVLEKDPTLKPKPAFEETGVPSLPPIPKQELPTKTDQSKLKPGEVQVPGSKTKVLKLPNGTPYEVQRSTPGQIYNLKTGGYH